MFGKKKLSREVLHKQIEVQQRQIYILEQQTAALLDILKDKKVLTKNEAKMLCLFGKLVKTQKNYK